MKYLKDGKKRAAGNYCDGHARERKLQVDDNSEEVYDGTKVNKWSWQYDKRTNKRTDKNMRHW